jgi:hypothetical protein
VTGIRLRQARIAAVMAAVAAGCHDRQDGSETGVLRAAEVS